MITSLTNPKIKHINMLRKHSKIRKEEKLFIIEGLRMFEETPDELLEDVFVTQSFFDEYSDKKRLTHVAAQVVSDEVFKKMSDTVSPQGVMASVKCLSYRESEIAKEGCFLLMLEDIQDPGNLGTLIRTAEGAGVDAIVMSKGCVDIYSPKVIRSTMGAIFRMPFISVESMPRYIKYLREKDVKVYAAALGFDTEYTNADYTESIAIVIGNEGNGLTQSTIEAADRAVTIPMGGKLESLNAAVSGAILMYEARRNRV